MLIQYDYSKINYFKSQNVLFKSLTTFKQHGLGNEKQLIYVQRSGNKTIDLTNVHSKLHSFATICL